MRMLAGQALLADSNHWNGPGWWIVFPICWFVLLVGLIVLLVSRRRACGPWGGPWSSRGPWSAPWSGGAPGEWRPGQRGPAAGQSRLADRFAAGEIDEQEYRQRLAILREQP